MDEPEKPRRRVVAIPKPPKPVNEATVAMLRGLLERAEKGEIVEAAVVSVTHDGLGERDWPELDYGNLILGELFLLADEISESLRSED